MSELDDLKQQFLVDQMPKEELTHHGVPGMKWGKRRASGSTGGTSTKSDPKGDGKNAVTGFFDRPNAAKALVLGSYGKKSSYTNPVALSNRKKAGALRVAGIIGIIGGKAISAAGKNNAGAQVVGGLISAGSGAVLIGSLVKGTQGAIQEKSARNAS